MSESRAPRVFRPDLANRIDLPGVGPCPRPVDLHRGRTGFSALVALRIYRFGAGKTIDGEAEGDEVFITLVRGAAALSIRQGGVAVGEHRLGEEGDDRVAYLPPHATYRLHAVTDCDIAYARARPAGETFPAPRAFAVDRDDTLAIDGHAIGMTLRLAVVERDGVIALDDGDDAAERFVHVRTDRGARAILSDESLGDWDTAALTGPATLRADVAVTMLAIAARAPR